MFVFEVFAFAYALDAEYTDPYDDTNAYDYDSEDVCDKYSYYYDWCECYYPGDPYCGYYDESIEECVIGADYSEYGICSGGFNMRGGNNSYECDDDGLGNGIWSDYLCSDYGECNIGEEWGLCGDFISPAYTCDDVNGYGYWSSYLCQDCLLSDGEIEEIVVDGFESNDGCYYCSNGNLEETELDGCVYSVNVEEESTACSDLDSSCFTVGETQVCLISNEQFGEKTCENKGGEYCDWSECLPSNNLVSSKPSDPSDSDCRAVGCENSQECDYETGKCKYKLNQKNVAEKKTKGIVKEIAKGIYNQGITDPKELESVLGNVISDSVKKLNIDKINPEDRSVVQRAVSDVLAGYSLDDSDKAISDKVTELIQSNIQKNEKNPNYGVIRAVQPSDLTGYTNKILANVFGVDNYLSVRNSDFMNKLIGSPFNPPPREVLLDMPLDVRMQYSGVVGMLLGEASMVEKPFEKNENDNALVQTGKGLVNGATEFVTGALMSPVGLMGIGGATLPGMGSKSVSAVFGFDMAKGTIEGAIGTVDAIKKGDYQGAIESAVVTVGSAYFAGKTAQHLAGIEPSLAARQKAAEADIANIQGRLETEVAKGTNPDFINELNLQLSESKQKAEQIKSVVDKLNAPAVEPSTSPAAQVARPGFAESVKSAIENYLPRGLGSEAGAVGSSPFQETVGRANAKKAKASVPSEPVRAETPLEARERILAEQERLLTERDNLNNRNSLNDQNSLTPEEQARLKQVNDRLAQIEKNEYSPPVETPTTVTTPSVPSSPVAGIHKAVPSTSGTGKTSSIPPGKATTSVSVPSSKSSTGSSGPKAGFFPAVPSDLTSAKSVDVAKAKANVQPTSIWNNVKNILGPGTEGGAVDKVLPNSGRGLISKKIADRKGVDFSVSNAPKDIAPVGDISVGEKEKAGTILNPSGSAELKKAIANAKKLLQSGSEDINKLEAAADKLSKFNNEDLWYAGGVDLQLALGDRIGKLKSPSVEIGGLSVKQLKSAYIPEANSLLPNSEVVTVYHGTNDLTKFLQDGPSSSRNLFVGDMATAMRASQGQGTNAGIIVFRVPKDIADKILPAEKPYGGGVSDESGGGYERELTPEQARKLFKYRADIIQ